MKPRDEVKRDLIQQWIAKAEVDLGVAQHLLAEGIYFDALGFHAQQAAEKYLKALLCAMQVEFPKTHDLEDLLDLIGTKKPELTATLEEIVTLNDYGVDIRYPGDHYELTLAEARKAVEHAEKTKTSILPEINMLAS